jgi:hypothetical protein
MSARDLPDDARRRVESALKATIESELSRATFTRPQDALGYFSRGAIFSRSNGFSKGIIFSRNYSELERLDESIILDSAAQLDDVTFSAFAARLAEISAAKQVKGGPG